MLGSSIQQEDENVHRTPTDPGVRTVRSIDSIDVLVVAAYAPELSLLAEAIGGSTSPPADANPHFRARVREIDVVGYAVGVGLVAAAVGVSRALQAFRPQAVIAVGTCGAYDGRAGTRGDVVRARRMHLVSTSALEKRAGLPSLMAATDSADPRLSSGFDRLGLAEVDVATTLAVTMDDALAARIRDAHDCDVEHLEAYSIAAACATFGVPLAGIFGIANRVGKGGREEWLKYHQTAELAAASTVLRWLDLLADGLAEGVSRERRDR
jgi:nucleoside phosphorylase